MNEGMSWIREIEMMKTLTVYCCIADCLGFGKSNLNVEFHNKVYKSLESR